MSENEQDYTAYITSISSEVQTYAFFGGFIFTAITIILTLLPDPSTLQAQIALFFLTFLFYCLLSLLVSHFYKIALCAKTAPPSIPHEVAWGRLEGLVWYMIEIAVVLMFLLWNLTYLAIGSGIMYIMFNVIQYYKLEKPAEKALDDAWAEE